MSFDWKENYGVANDVSVASKSLKAGKKEAYQRTAINRAYYAAFKEAEELLIRRKLIDPVDEAFNLENQGGSHQRVIRALSNHRAREARRAGELLMDMKSARIKADYQKQLDNNTPIERLVQDTINNAKEVLKLLRVL
jgi:uncharacterized protein (UPF0332 family)